jgi:alkylhydroperoxidase family enzyme
MRSILLPVLAGLAALGPSARGQTPATPPRFPAVSSADAWKKLRGADPALPAWARVLVRPLPKTTAAMLHLDHLHRAKNPLGPVLAGKLHWAAADAIGCAYGKRYAEADLRRAGLTDDDFKKLDGDPARLPEADRLALAFARKLTKAAWSVSDEEMAALLKQFGPDRLVAMVHTLAWANFQNRILLALHVEVEPDGPLPPLDPALDAASLAKIAAPARPPWKEARAVAVPAELLARPDWREQSDDERAAALERQKGRKARIPLPDPKRLADLPPAAKAQAARVSWSNVSMGYQPLLTLTWFDTLRAFYLEAMPDRVFTNSMFWVITRSNECFY